MPVVKKTKQKTKTIPDVKVINTRRYVQQESIKDLITMTYTARTELMNTLLDGKKDINYICQYPDRITINNYKAMYDREGIAKRVVHILPEDSWGVLPDVYETEDENETTFEIEWKELCKKYKLFHYLLRIDILSGIGQYGVILFGLNDGQELHEPVSGVDPKTGKKTGSGRHELTYIKVFDQQNITIDQKDNDSSSPRYGKPVLYSISYDREEVVGGKETKAKVKVHWTRILHIADNRECSEIYGTPRMKSVYNRLLDLRKLVGGSAEMYYKGAFPGLAFETMPDYTGIPDEDDMKDTVEAYTNGLQRYLNISGVTIKSLEPQVSSPKDHFETQLFYIAITLGIPYRIFLGSEQAHQASTQDISTYNKRLNKRQNDYITPMILQPFIARLIAYGVLSEPREVIIDWPDLNAPSDNEKADVANKITEAMSKYVNGGVSELISPKQFFMKILGYSQEEADSIEEDIVNWQLALPKPKEVEKDIDDAKSSKE
jgi:hypothetical protein